MQRFICLEDNSPIEFLLKKFVNNIEIVNYNLELNIKKDDIIITNYMLNFLKNNKINHNIHISNVLSKFNNKIIFDDIMEPDKKIDTKIKNYKYFDPNVLYFSFTGNIENKPKNLIYVPNVCWPIFYFYFKHLPYLHLDYNYIPNKTFTKKFLMPIRRESRWRREVINQLSDFLPESIYSANWMNINLPNDYENNENTNDLYFLPSWYDSTYYSIVLETCILNTTAQHISEKTYKPINFFHPFMIISRPNHLSTLRDWGFETYENIFDESYDSEPDLQKKLQIIKNNICNYNYNFKYDKLTLEKIDHNHNHFNNYDLIKKIFFNEIYDPILNFINSQ